MESGSILGIFSSVTVLALVVTLIARFFAGKITWQKAGCYSIAIVLSAISVCGINFLLAVSLNVTDSSHGAMSLGLPVVSACAGSLLALFVIVVSALRT